MTLSKIATSRTVRAMGPAVSWLAEMGMMPERLTSPMVGFMPARPLTDEGPVTDPSVSLPTAAAHKLLAVAAPDPELEPDGLRSSAYGHLVWPPTPLQALVEW